MAQLSNGLRRAVYGVFGALILLVNWAVSGLVVWVTLSIGFWAFPLFFGLGMGMAALVFHVLLPSEYGDWTKRLPKHGRIRDALAWIRKVVTPDSAKFERGTFWPRLQRYGAFWFILAATMLLSPLVGAFVARYLKLPDAKAWWYMTVSVGLMVGIFTSLYLGVLAPVIDWAEDLL